VSQANVSSDATYIHRYLARTDPVQPPMLLLHRTGGNEDDLIPVAKEIAPGSALVALRGNVLEAGKPRFFRRVAKGQFDIADLKRRTDELAGFINWMRDAYDLTDPIAFGFSNGANIVWSLLLQHPKILRGAILLRPTLAYDPRPVGGLSGVPVLVVAGRNDSTVPPARANDLPDLLTEAGACVCLEWAEADHILSSEDGVIAAKWLKTLNVQK
jgi:phospholipase/carboxylesterase